MAVSYDAFLGWAESRFDNVKTSGREVMLNSPFPEREGLEPDLKNHLYCNVEGGKYKRKNGVWKCWKTDKTGTLTGLVMLIDGCTYEEALEVLGGSTRLAAQEKIVEDFFNRKENKPEPKIEKALRYPESTFSLEELQHLPVGQEAMKYVVGRKLPIENLKFCTRGKYRNRIIIPYYDQEGRLFYWNGRHLFDKKPKYLGPPKEWGIGKGQVLFMTEWPKPKTTIYLCEGEFDAMSLAQAGLPAAAVGGKSLSGDETKLGDTQLQLLRPYKVCLALDADSFGKQAVFQMAESLQLYRIPVFYAPPPEKFKDWNNMLIKINDPSVIAAYLVNKKQILNTHLTMWEI